MSKKKKAIIFGVTGQDGAYLSNFLLNKNYDIIGTTRNKSYKNLFRLKKLNLLRKITLIKGQASNITFCEQVLNSRIDEVYYLAGYSSVTGSFNNPYLSLESNTLGIVNILQVIKKRNYKIKVFNAGSGQFYGDNKKNFYSLSSKIEPQSPYGVSKAAAYWMIKIFRENYNIFCCTGVLFNHESSLRSNEFVTKKIVNFTKKIKKNKKLTLKLGNVDIYRDWGWAPEYVEAFWLMLQQKKPEDHIIGTGNTYTIKQFVKKVFRLQNLSFKNLKINEKKFKRKLDIRGYKADISLTKKKLKWTPKIGFDEIIYKMCNDELF